jgi:hypothetical protein
MQSLRPAHGAVCLSGSSSCRGNRVQTKTLEREDTAVHLVDGRGRCVAEAARGVLQPVRQQALELGQREVVRHAGSRRPCRRGARGSPVRGVRRRHQRSDERRVVHHAAPRGVVPRHQLLEVVVVELDLCRTRHTPTGVRNPGSARCRPYGSGAVNMPSAETCVLSAGIPEGQKGAHVKQP